MNALLHKARLLMQDGLDRLRPAGGRMDYEINGYERIYHVHVRKTGGTSLNKMFLSLDGGDYESLYRDLAFAPEHRVEHADKVFVGWNGRLIRQGRYFYAFSHLPWHALRLPAGTLTVTCFRDPVARVVSHYKMLKEFQLQQVPHPCMREEGPWLGAGFGDFIRNLPREHLLNQVYMFSRRFEMEEALEAVGRVTCVLFTETFDAGVADLCLKTGLPLRTMHLRKSTHQAEVTETDLALLREMLEPEYEFLRRLRGVGRDAFGDGCC